MQQPPGATRSAYCSGTCDRHSASSSAPKNEAAKTAWPLGKPWPDSITRASSAFRPRPPGQLLEAEVYHWRQRGGSEKSGLRPPFQDQSAGYHRQRNRRHGDCSADAPRADD